MPRQLRRTTASASKSKRRIQRVASSRRGAGRSGKPGNRTTCPRRPATGSQGWSHQLAMRRPRTRMRGALDRTPARRGSWPREQRARPLMKAAMRLGRMLTVGVHGQRVGEAGRAAPRAIRRGARHPCRRCSRAPAPAGPGRRARALPEQFGRAVSAAIHDDPDRGPLGAGVAHGIATASRPGCSSESAPGEWRMGVNRRSQPGAWTADHPRARRSPSLQ